MSFRTGSSILKADVAIIGAGFSGTMVAVHLSNLPDPPTVALIERQRRFGRGVAYGTRDSSHLLNVPCGKMGAFPKDPEHFWKWLQRHPVKWRTTGAENVHPAGFVPRLLYGDYLEDLLREAGRRNDHLSRVRQEAIDVIAFRDGTFQVELRDRRKIEAQKVVLALGNFPPGDPPLRERRFHESRSYLSTPWAEKTRAQLAEPGDILILGSGLTGLDLLQSLAKTKKSGMIHVLSRRGLFPQPHQPCQTYPPFLDLENLPNTALDLLRRVRSETQHAIGLGADWRSVVDSIRPFTQQVWRRLSLSERQRFMRHLRSYWESHRHRAAPQALAVKRTLESQGRLQCHRGRVTSIREAANGLQVVFEERAARNESVLMVRYVVNCTGPECNYHKLKDPLIIQLFARGLISPDPLYLGLDVGTGGVIHDFRGERVPNLHTLGSPQKGRLFETTAVPELRLQAQELAQRIAEDLSAKPFSNDRYRQNPAYAYEI